MKNFFKASGGGGSFLPEDYVAKKAEFRANVIILSLFGIVMILVVMAFFVTTRRWKDIRAEQLTISDQYMQERVKIEQLDALDKERRKMLNKAEVTTSLLEKIPRSVLLSELVTKLPGNVTFEEVELVSRRIDPAKEAAALAAAGAGNSKVPPPPAGGKVKTLAPSAPLNPVDAVKAEAKPPRFESTIKISGISTVYNDITDYAATLQACPLLEKVELVYIKEAKVKDRDFHKFEITAQLRTTADARAITRPDRLVEFTKPVPRNQTPAMGPPQGRTAEVVEKETSAAR